MCAVCFCAKRQLTTKIYFALTGNIINNTLRHEYLKLIILNTMARDTGAFEILKSLCVQYDLVLLKRVIPCGVKHPLGILIVYSPRWNHVGVSASALGSLNQPSAWPYFLLCFQTVQLHLQKKQKMDKTKVETTQNRQCHCTLDGTTIKRLLREYFDSFQAFSLMLNKVGLPQY